MSLTGRCRRVRFYVDETDLWGAEPLFLALIERLRAEGCAGATAFRGIAGFGAHSQIHTASIVRLSGDLPIVVEWIDTFEQVEQVLPTVASMVREGPVTTEDVEVVIYQHRS